MFLSRLSATRSLAPAGNTDKLSQLFCGLVSQLTFPGSNLLHRKDTDQCPAAINICRAPITDWESGFVNAL